MEGPSGTKREGGGRCAVACRADLGTGALKGASPGAEVVLPRVRLQRGQAKGNRGEEASDVRDYQSRQRRGRMRGTRGRGSST